MRFLEAKSRACPGEPGGHDDDDAFYLIERLAQGVCKPSTLTTTIFRPETIARTLGTRVPDSLSESRSRERVSGLLVLDSINSTPQLL